MPCAVRTLKKLIWRVQPGVELVRARFFRFINLLSKLLLPTLERPAKAISICIGGGNSAWPLAAAENSALTMRGALAASLAGGAGFFAKAMDNAGAVAENSAARTAAADRRD